MVDMAASHASNEMSQEDDALTGRLLMLNGGHTANDDRGNDEADHTGERSPPPANEKGPERATEKEQHNREPPA